MSKTDTSDRVFDDDGLVVPRKLANPSLESREKKDLHREMLWKMKYGSNDSKDCEYRKAYKNYQQRQKLKAVEMEESKRITFEKLLEEQRQRLNTVGKVTACPDEYSHSSLGHSANDPLDDDSGPASATKKDEFYRVFSKVRAKNLQEDPSSSQSMTGASKASV